MAKILHLLFCGTCTKQLKRGMGYTKWEGALYCDDCFDEYLDMIENTVFFSDNHDKR